MLAIRRVTRPLCLLLITALLVAVAEPLLSSTPVYAAPPPEQSPPTGSSSSVAPLLAQYELAVAQLARAEDANACVSARDRLTEIWPLVQQAGMTLRAEVVAQGDAQRLADFDRRLSAATQANVELAQLAELDPATITELVPRLRTESRDAIKRDSAVWAALVAAHTHPGVDESSFDWMSCVLLQPA